MRRSFVFHYHGTTGNEARMEPAYYLDADYEPVAVRIYAGTTPTSDAEINIFRDGTSIFEKSGILSSQ